MFLYVIMAAWAGLGLGVECAPSFMMAQAIAPTGAMFTFLALLTGCDVGQTDLGCVVGVGCPADVGTDSAVSVYRDHLVCARRLTTCAAPIARDAVFALVGVVNVPIIYFSVRWWNTLHQGASVSMTASPKMAATMVTAMLVMTLGFWMYSFAVTLARVRCVIAERERRNRRGARMPRFRKWRRRADAVGSPTEFWAMGGYGLYVDLVRRHGPVHGVGSTCSMASTCSAAGSRDVS